MEATVAIRCRDLMIGDWFLTSDGVPCRVDQNFGNHVWGYGQDLSISTDDPYAIPITKEILEKNGFSPETFLTDEWERKVYFKELSSCVVEPADSGKYIFGTTKYWSQTDSDGSPIVWGTMYESRIYNLQYVHELQRALRCCGLWDIAENFKV